jgi:Putative quorum-sensing-regulated virulence factor
MVDVDASSVSLPFGKHKGVPLADVPRSYLEWALAEGVLRSEALRRAVQAELARRGSRGEPAPGDAVQPRPRKAGSPATAPTGPSPGLLAPAVWPAEVRTAALHIVRVGAGALSGRNRMTPPLARAHSLLVRWLAPTAASADESDVPF